MRSWVFFVLFVAMSFCAESTEPKRWVVYYSDEAEIGEFAPYSLVVLDSDKHPFLLPFFERGKTVLGYLSLGEVERYRSYFQEVRKEGILLQENKDWKGSYFVDVRDKRWAKRVIEELIPNILHQKFDGLFLDTLDNPEYLENLDPEMYRGMEQAAIDLVKAIRIHYPNIKIMMNRGYGLLPELADTIDMELGESVYADYDFRDGTYKIVNRGDYLKQVVILKRARKTNPHLEVYTLDYWYPNDKEKIKEIYAKERHNGFIPYVATIKLDKIIAEPQDNE